MSQPLSTNNGQLGLGSPCQKPGSLQPCNIISVKQTRPVKGRQCYTGITLILLYYLCIDIVYYNGIHGMVNMLMDKI